jgi:hypothetical protein
MLSEVTTAVFSSRHKEKQGISDFVPLPQGDGMSLPLQNPVGAYVDFVNLINDRSTAFCLCRIPYNFAYVGFHTFVSLGMQEAVRFS